MAFAGTLVTVLGAAFVLAETGGSNSDEKRYRSRVETAAIRYTREGPFLDWGSGPPARFGDQQRFDRQGVPLLRFPVGGRLKFVYNPIRIIQYGLEEFSYFELGKGRAHLVTAMRMGDWLVEHQDRSGRWLYDFEYSPVGTGVTLGSGWSSAIAQGQAMSLLTRLYSQNRNHAYLEAARRAVRPLERPVSRGGLLASLRGQPFFEEYPTRPPNFVLNGFIFTLLGLYDLSPHSQQADRAYRAGLNTLQRVLPLYDEGRRGITYHLAQLTSPGRSPVYGTCDYNRLHVVLLDAMNSIDPKKVYRRYRDRWYHLPCGNTPSNVQNGGGELNLRWLVPLAMLVVGAAISLVLAVLLPQDRRGLAWAWAVFAHTAAAALAAVVWLRLGFQVTAKGNLSVDGLTLEMITVIGICGALAVVFAHAATEEAHSRRETPAVLCVASAASAGLVAATNITFVVVGMAGLALSGLILVRDEGVRPRELRRRLPYLLLTVVAVAGIPAALVAYVRDDVGTDLAAIGRSIPDGASAVIAALAALACAALLLWAARDALSRSVEESAIWRVGVAPYLLGVVAPALILSLGRALQLLLPLGSLAWPGAIAAVSVAAMTAGNLAALRQRDVRRIIGAASVSQIGFALVGLSALTSKDGLPATVFFLTTYAIATLTALVAAIAIADEQDSWRVASLRGLARRHPWWSAAFGLALLSLAGVPPLPGFFGKLAVLEAGGDAHGAWLVWAGLANAVLSLVVYVRLLAPTVRPVQLSPSQPVLKSPSRCLTWALLIAAIMLVAVAGLTEPLLRLAENAVAWGG